MSSFNRRIFLSFLVALPVAACGFTPIYRQGSAGKSLMGRLRFNLTETREGFLLLEQLEQRFGAGDAVDFDVIITLKTTEDTLTLTAATSLDRITVTGKAHLSVKSKATGNEVFADDLRETTGFSSNKETAVTAQSRRDAHDRLVKSLADKIALRLSSTAAGWAS